jgi:hypothetical protein
MLKLRAIDSFFIRKLLRRRFARKVRAKAKEKQRNFLILSSLDAEAKQKLVGSVAHLHVQLAALDTWNGFVRIAVLPLFLLTIYASILIGPWLLGLSLPLYQDKFLHDWTDNISNIGAAWLLGWFVLMLPWFLRLFVSRRAAEYFQFSNLMLAWMIGGTLVYAAIASGVIMRGGDTPSTYERAVGTAGVSIVAFTSVTYAGAFSLAFFNNVLSVRRKRLWPNAVVAELLLEVLQKTEKQKREWKSIEFKREIIRKLEEIADCIERHFPWRLRSGNPGTDFWQRQTAEQISAGVRNLMRWVYTPKEDTRQEFIKRVSSYLVLAISDDWDGFERVEPPTVSRPELLRSRLKTAVTAVFSALVPLAVLLIVKQLNLIEGPVLTYLTVGAYIWTGLSLLSNVDPSYGSKFAAIKDISSLLPLPKRDKD